LQREWAGKGKLLDVGSGGGLPGVVIAIMRPDLEVSCLDAVAKKAAFVQQVSAELELPNLRGLHARVELLEGSYDVISSRAFASLPDFFNGSKHLLAPGGVWLAMKGKVPSDELAVCPGRCCVSRGTTDGSLASMPSAASSGRARNRTLPPLIRSQVRGPRAPDFRSIP
jgi:16S rRNA (guanine527-N7)-methyltransferase